MKQPFCTFDGNHSATNCAVVTNNNASMLGDEMVKPHQRTAQKVARIISDGRGLCSES